MALYANDLFLNDAPPLQGLLTIMDMFSTYMGLRVDWNKSQLIPVDGGGLRRSSTVTLPLQWVDTFTYLGIVVSHNVSDFKILNLHPAPLDVRSKLKAWGNLPLPLLPQWLPQKHFHTAQLTVYILFNGAHNHQGTNFPRLLTLP